LDRTDATDRTRAQESLARLPQGGGKGLQAGSAGAYTGAMRNAAMCGLVSGTARGGAGRGGGGGPSRQQAPR
jgi:hypothetical protein